MLHSLLNSSLLFDGVMLIAVFLIVVVTVGGIVLVVFLSKDELKEEKRKKEEMWNEPIAEPQTEFIHARILQKQINSHYYKGLHLPMNVTSYVLVFETEDGNTLEFTVPEEFFVKTEEGQEGTLVTVNGTFFDFGDGEDIEGDTEQ